MWLPKFEWRKWAQILNLKYIFSGHDCYLMLTVLKSWSYIPGHLTAKSDVYSFGVVLLELLTGRRSMDKTRPIGEHNLVEWARPYLSEKRRFYRLVDPRLEGHFSIKGAQQAVHLAACCLTRDAKIRPTMAEIVKALEPLPMLKDMACSSSYSQAMNNAPPRNGVRMVKNGQPTRSPMLPNQYQGSPYQNVSPFWSPLPNNRWRGFWIACVFEIWKNQFCLL